MKKVFMGLFALVLCFSVNAQTNPYDKVGVQSAKVLIHYLELADNGTTIGNEDDLQKDLMKMLEENGVSISEDDLSKTKEIVKGFVNMDIKEVLEKGNASSGMRQLVNEIISQVKSTNPEDPKSIRNFNLFIKNTETKLLEDGYVLEPKEKENMLIGISTIKYVIVALADDISLTSTNNMTYKVYNASYTGTTKILLLKKFWKWLAGAVSAVVCVVAAGVTGGAANVLVAAIGFGFGFEMGNIFLNGHG